MARNFGFEKERDYDEEKKVEFWTGFITGAVSGVLGCVIVVLGLIWKYPV